MSNLKATLAQALKRVLYRHDYRLAHVGSPNFLEFLVYSCLRKYDGLFFIQIGANDGRSFDPIYQFVTRNHSRVRGIVVEPVREYFDELVVTYKKYPSVIAINSAIHNSEREMTLYKVDPDRMKGLSAWAKGIASFDGRHHTLSGIPSDAIVSEKVRCMPLNELLESHRVAEIDLLQIDTEGYDSEIIRNLDFGTIKPRIIHFEHGLPAKIMSRQTFLSVSEVLHRNGYEIAIEHYDATAYQPSIIVDL